MKIKRNYTIDIVIGVIVIIIFSISAIFSFRAHYLTQKNNTEYLNLVQMLQKDIRRFETDLAALSKRLGELGKPNSSFLLQNRKPDDLISGKPNPLPENLSELKQRINAAGLEQLRLRQILESTGLDLLAEMEDLDPSILKELYDERAGKKEIDAVRAQLRGKNKELHQADKNRYDEELASLYERARFRGMRNISREDREKAFQDMLLKYPDAYATGMLVAERALFSAYRRNTTEGEKYYRMLQENSNFSDVITDRGIEATPNVAYNLASQYIREGRTEEANRMLDALKNDYPDSLLFVRTRGRGMTWRTVSRAAPLLRIRMNKE